MQGMAKQAEHFHAALLADRSVNMKEDWKVLTIWIGANNECPSCEKHPHDQPATYEVELTKAIDYLQDNVPRLFVNLVAMLNLTSLTTAKGVPEHCVVEHILTREECPCAFKNKADGKSARARSRTLPPNLKADGKSARARSRTLPLTLTLTLTLRPTVQHTAA